MPALCTTASTRERRHSASQPARPESATGLREPGVGIDGRDIETCLSSEGDSCYIDVGALPYPPIIPRRRRHHTAFRVARLHRNSAIRPRRTWRGTGRPPRPPHLRPRSRSTGLRPSKPTGTAVREQPEQCHDRKPGTVSARFGETGSAARKPAQGRVPAHPGQSREATRLRQRPQPHQPREATRLQQQPHQSTARRNSAPAMTAPDQPHAATRSPQQPHHINRTPDPTPATTAPDQLRAAIRLRRRPYAT